MVLEVQHVPWVLLQLQLLEALLHHLLLGGCHLVPYLCLQQALLLFAQLDCLEQLKHLQLYLPHLQLSFHLLNLDVQHLLLLVLQLLLLGTLHHLLDLLYMRKIVILVHLPSLTHQASLVMLSLRFFAVPLLQMLPIQFGSPIEHLVCPLH